MLPRLVTPPWLRGGSGEEGERRATWLELFYDLGFVVTVSTLASRLSGDYSPVSALQFVGLFVPVWWAWVGHTIYATRFDTDDVTHRVCTFALMLAAAAMAVQIPYALEGGSAGFAAAYVGARLSLLVLYA
jgi:low temperature requirement protein LtrA